VRECDHADINAMGSVTLKDEWVFRCLSLARKDADLWEAAQRKILRQRSITFEYWDDSLQLEDVGYKSAKLKQLERLYLNEESRAAAVELWMKRRCIARYGSVGFHCYNHFVKSAARDSEQGPCLQSVVITWLNKSEAGIDVGYRSTEWFKKFPADIVFLRDVLLEPFDLSGMQFTVTFHFANITIHPGYWATVLPHLPDPISVMERVREHDPQFHRVMFNWTRAYLCPEHSASIAKHTQSLRVQKHVLAAIKGSRRRALQTYLRGTRSPHVP
jgi:hypothetical protein